MTASHPVSCQLADALTVVPLLRKLVWSESAGALASCSQNLRHVVHGFTCQVLLSEVDQISHIVKSDWEQLSAVILPGTDRLFQWPSGSLELLGRLDLWIAADPGPVKNAVFIVRPKEQLSHPSVQYTCLSVLAKPQWRRLYQLTIQNSMLHAEGFAQLAQLEWPILRRLEVCGDNLATALLGLTNAAWPALQAISMSHHAYLAAAQARVPTLYWYSSLAPAQRALCSNSTARLPQMASCTRLVRLEMQGIPLEASFFHELSDAYCARLEVLSLSWVDLTAAMLSDLMHVSWPNLRHLGLSHTGLAKDALTALARADLPSLLYFNLGHNELDADAVRCLITAKWYCLEALWVCDNLLDNVAMLHLSAGMWPKLAELHVSGNCRRSRFQCLVNGQLASIALFRG